MRNKGIIFILLLSVTAAAQEPTSRLQISMLESQLAAAKLARDTAILRREELEREIAQIRAAVEQRVSVEQSKVSAAEQRIAVERARSVTAISAVESDRDAKLAERDAKLVERDRRIVILIADRDAALRDLKHARGWKVSLARVFGLKK